MDCMLAIDATYPDQIALLFRFVHLEFFNGHKLLAGRMFCQIYNANTKAAVR